MYAYIDRWIGLLRVCQAPFPQNSPSYKVFYAQSQVLYSDNLKHAIYESAGSEGWRSWGAQLDPSASCHYPGSWKHGEERDKSPAIRNVQPVSVMLCALYSLIKTANGWRLCQEDSKGINEMALGGESKTKSVVISEDWGWPSFDLHLPIELKSSIHPDP